MPKKLLNFVSDHISISFAKSWSVDFTDWTAIHNFHLWSQRPWSRARFRLDSNFV